MLAQSYTLLTRSPWVAAKSDSPMGTSGREPPTGPPCLATTRACGLRCCRTATREHSTCSRRCCATAPETGYRQLKPRPTHTSNKRNTRCRGSTVFALHVANVANAASADPLRAHVPIKLCSHRFKLREISSRYLGQPTLIWENTFFRF